MKCLDCDCDLPLKVCQSAAGFYAGTWCDNCGPYSRESGYFRTREEAEDEVRWQLGLEPGEEIE